MGLTMNLFTSPLNFPNNAPFSNNSTANFSFFSHPLPSRYKSPNA